MPESVLTPGAGEHRDARAAQELDRLRRACASVAIGASMPVAPRRLPSTGAPESRHVGFPECFRALAGWRDERDPCTSTESATRHPTAVRRLRPAHRRRAARASRAGRRSLHRRVGEGDRAARSPPATARARCCCRSSGWPTSSRCWRPFRRPRATSATPTLLEAITGYHVHRGALAAMHRPGAAPIPPSCSRTPDASSCSRTSSTTPTSARSSARSPGSAPTPCSSRPRCADPLYRRSVRVSMGTVLQVPWTRLPEWPEARRTAARARLHDRRARARRRRGRAATTFAADRARAGRARASAPRATG